MKPLTFTRHAANTSINAPSMVARLLLTGARPEPVPVLIADGRALSGVGVAGVRDGGVRIGTVFEAQLLICRAES